MNKFALSLAALLLVPACSNAPETAPLAGARIGGPFSLIDQNGKRVTDRDFAGSYRLVYFGYTFCPDVCPVDVQKLMAGLKAFETRDAARAAKVQPIFVTVDPARDTPPALKAFVSAFHPRLVGLTGSEAEIAGAAKAFAVVYQRQKPNAEGGYLVDHSRTAVLFGPDGKPIALVTQDGAPDVIAGELARWVA